MTEKKHSAKFSVNMSIPRLTSDGVRVAHELAGFHIIHERDGRKSSLSPDKVTQEVIEHEIDDIMKLDQIQQQTALRSLLAGMIDLAKQSVGIATWAIQADAFLQTIPAKFQALEGADIHSVKPSDDSHN